MPTKANHKRRRIVDDIYLAYARALSATSDADIADFVAEYAAPCRAATPKQRISKKLCTSRKRSSRVYRRPPVPVAPMVKGVVKRVS